MRSRLRGRPSADDIRGGPIPGNFVTLLHDGQQCFPALLEDIGRAKQEILLEMYWFGSDMTGRRFAEALADAAKRGLDVRVVYDSVGCYDTDGTMFDEMRAAGCRVFEYNPIAPWRRRFRLDRINHRNHRKVLVIDGRVAFTGGINLADEWAAKSDGGDGWRDDMIRVEGPAARAMRALVCKVLPDMSDVCRTWQDCVQDVPCCGDSTVRILTNDYREERRAIRQAYLRWIRQAKQEIVIANSYFIPDRVVRSALAAAVRRGVLVRVLLPGLSDVPAVRYASHRLYHWLLQRGIRIFEWNHSVMHNKTAVVDDCWCTVGSYNLDYRSWLFNLEVNVAIEDRNVARRLRDRLDEDFEGAVKIDLQHWQYRSLWDRLLERFFYLFRKLL